MARKMRASNHKKKQTMPAQPYIPARDADYQNWLANFSTLLTATPVLYGLVAGDATIVAAAYSAWSAAYILATNPTTRTAPTIADKTAQRNAATATVRPYAQQIAANAGVSDMDKVAIGVNPPNPTRTPIPAPLTTPILALVSVLQQSTTLGYADASTPLTKAKPFGATGLQLYQTIGTAPAVAPDAADFVGVYTKSPMTLANDAGDAGKVRTLWGRWVTKSGPAGVAQVGPWSAALSYNLL